MPNGRPTAFTIAELGEVDRLSYIKAGSILAEARNYLARVDYDLAVRRSQEAFELYMKSLFRFLQIEYPASHDLVKQIHALTGAAEGYPIDKRQIARLVLANAVFKPWRSLAFYGEEGLGVGTFFDDGEAKLALSYAELAQLVCGVVRASVYRQVTK